MPLMTEPATWLKCDEIQLHTGLPGSARWREPALGLLHDPLVVAFGQVKKCDLSERAQRGASYKYSTVSQALMEIR